MHRLGIRRACSRVANARSNSLRRTTVLAAIVISAIAALLLGAAAPPAHASRVIKCVVGTTTTCVTVCRQQLANGGSVDYGEGTEIAVNLTDGTTQTFTCRNGQWVRTSVAAGNSPGIVGHDMGVGEFQGTITVITCPVDVNTLEPIPCPPDETVGPPGKNVSP